MVVTSCPPKPGGQKKATYALTLFDPGPDVGDDKLLAMTQYVSTHKSGYEIYRDDALWMWISGDYKTAGHGLAKIISFTGQENALVVHQFGMENTRGHTDREAVVIGKEVRHQSRKSEIC